ncbi:MAG TPA: ATP-binding protein [Solimonas sp.]|nr:ATP-binding protein [Solimonas sp.]
MFFSQTRDGTPQQREVYFFALYRLLEAGLLALIAFAPAGMLPSELIFPSVAKLGAVAYVAIALWLLAASLRSQMRLRRQAALGLLIDLGAFALALAVQDGLEGGVFLLLLFNIGAGALILTAQSSLGFATLAATMVMGDFVVSRLTPGGVDRPLAEAVMFAVTYLAAAVLFQLLGRQMSQTQALAEKRGVELANLAEINELVIRRMRTGVLVVDGGHRIRLANEAAWALLGNPSPNRRDLSEVAPALHHSLWQWRQGKGEVPKAMTLADDGVEVLPRFVALSLTDTVLLIFLEDSRIYSSRAEELTLATLGRLSASIAHEIRNPLAAINYSAQLLEESADLPDADRRLLEIILGQCQRMNGIVQNILGLARRERSMAESVELTTFTRRFVEEYRTNHPMDADVLQAVNPGRPVVAMVDPQHLHQVLTVLTQNALTYGRDPGQPAQVTVAVRTDGAHGPPLVEIIDRGPGIPPKVAEQVFSPFFTTSEHGTGLGLYIARQLCEANQCTLLFEPVPGGGSCFRITLPGAQSLFHNEAAASA